MPQVHIPKVGAYLSMPVSKLFLRSQKIILETTAEFSHFLRLGCPNINILKQKTRNVAIITGSKCKNGVPSGENDRLRKCGSRESRDVSGLLFRVSIDLNDMHDFTFCQVLFYYSYTVVIFSKSNSVCTFKKCLLFNLGNFIQSVSTEADINSFLQSPIWIDRTVRLPATCQNHAYKTWIDKSFKQYPLQLQHLSRRKTGSCWSNNR